MQNDEDVILYYKNNLKRLGYKYVSHYARIESKLIDILAEDKKKNPVIIEIKRSPINLKSIKQVLGYEKAYKAQYHKNAKLVLIGDTPGKAIEKECKKRGILLIDHLKGYPKTNTTKITIAIEDKLLKNIDKARGLITRSKFLSVVMKKIKWKKGMVK